MKNTLLPLLCLLTFGLYGQSGESQEQNMYRNYGTQVYQQLLYEEHSDLRQIHQEQEAWLTSPDGEHLSQPHAIPVVFHILNGPETKAIGEEVILNQIAVINRDFAHEKVIRHKADILEGFADRSRKIEITFCFPLRNPNGDLIDGPAVRTYQTDSIDWSLANNMKSERSGGIAPWDPNRFLNIWVVDLKNDVAGFAQMPGGPVLTDGIVIDRDFFGVRSEDSPFQQGRTLTHLIGSYLGLHELWNDYEYCADDGVADTPIHNGPNTRSFAYKHISLCPGYPVEMTMNFMDATQDRYQYLFTAGQKKRIQAMLSEKGPRSSLVETPVSCDPDLTQKALGDLQPTNTERGKNSSALIGRIFPNPAAEAIQLEVNGDTGQALTIDILSYNGTSLQRIRSKDFSGFEKWTFHLNEYPPGMYFIRITSDLAATWIQKIIVQR